MNNPLEIIQGGWFELNTMIEMYCDLCKQIYDQSGGESWGNVAYLAEGLATLEHEINTRLEHENDSEYKNIDHVMDIPQVKEVYAMWE